MNFFPIRCVGPLAGCLFACALAAPVMPNETAPPLPAASEGAVNPAEFLTAAATPLPTEDGTAAFKALAVSSNNAAMTPEPLAIPKVAVLDTIFTLNGVPRPELGVAVTDTLSARVMQSSAFDVLDASSASLSALVGGKPFLGVSPSFAVESGKAIGADLVVVPTVLGSATEYRITLKKLQVNTGKIENIITEICRPEMRSLLAAIETACDRLIPPPAQKQRPPATYIRAWMDGANLPPLEGEKPAPKALKSPPKPAAPLPKDLVKIGTLGVVNPEWAFTSVLCPPGTTGLKPKDRVTIWAGASRDRSVSLSVSRVEDGQIILDLPSDPATIAQLREGDEVFAWLSLKK
jgi:hypothetical protein